MMFYPGCASVKAQPRGVILVQGDRSNPLGTILCPLVSAIASGNGVVISIPEGCPKIDKMVRFYCQHFLDNRYTGVVMDADRDRVHSLQWDGVVFTGTREQAVSLCRSLSSTLTPVYLSLLTATVCVVDTTASISVTSMKYLY